MEISSSNIKKFQGMEALKKKIPFVSRNGIPKTLLIFWEMELLVHFKKISCISRNKNPEKISYIFLKERCSYISGKGNPPKKFLYLMKLNFLLFQEKETLKNLR